MTDAALTDPAIIALIAATFLLAGLVKGVIGLGLPTVSLAILAAAIDLPTAMALLIVPSLVTNLLQAATGGHARVLLRRIWPFLLMASITVWLGAKALRLAEPELLTGLLGGLLMAYAAISLSGWRVSLPERSEIWAGPVFGIANGILTGMTGSFVVPGVMFLQAIGLPRDRLIQAMGMLFTASTAALALALQANALFTGREGVMSLLALAPALLGMAAGQKVRRRLPEAAFRRIFFIAILALGGAILFKAVS
ncbi:MAG: sulfite exporter TauE/SafE family protein [Hyphomicrobiaceae bacterium]|nr:sulfite exporter TauE/SafE family protein [Hyphomicrobiaceae bacterium]